MKKYLMMGAAALLMGASFTSCSKDKDLYDPQANAMKFLQDYQAAFISVFGQPDINQTWGFGDPAATSRMTRSFEAPACPDIDAPYDEAWVATYLTTAQEPKIVDLSQPRLNNITNNHDHGYWDYGTSATWWSWKGDASTLQYNPQNFTGSEEDKEFFETYCRPFFLIKNGQGSWSEYFGCTDEVTATNYLYNILNEAGKWTSWVDGVAPSNPTWVPDENFVTNFKITGEYTGTIPVAQSEGYAVTYVDGVEVYGDRLDPFLARTIVVTGTWTINADQRMGSGSLIVIANGGKVIVPEGVELQTVNQARIVVLPGGELSGAGFVEVSNGNGAGGENYNAGTVNIGRFNNNYGKFYNYGTFIATNYNGGAKESNFYNHNLVKIDNFIDNTPNARVFNNCQFYIKNDARIRNYEGVGGSALIVGGQLHTGFSGDGTNDPTSVGLAAGALVKAGSLYNNGTSWSGPTEGGYAVVKIGQFDYMNWVDENPAAGGYFANNIYLVADNLLNVPAGNGMQQQTDDGSEYYTMSLAKWKFNYVANCVGNGNVTIAEEGNYEVIPADNDFVLGQAGCTPGFKIKKDDDPQPETKSIRIMAEDVAAAAGSDIDFNDVVFDVEATFAANATSTDKVTITVRAAGGTMPLYIGGVEVHEKMLPGVANNTKTMINTDANFWADGENYFAQDGVAPVSFDLNVTVRKDYFLQDVNTNVVVTVNNQGNIVPVLAEKGEPAAKIAVPVGTPWVREKINIGLAYSLFTDWVQNNSNSTNWYADPDRSKVME